MRYFLAIRSYQYKNMCLVKAKQEYRTILDVSERKKVSKNFVRQSLRKAEIYDFLVEGSTTKVCGNEIKVGMYLIKIDFSYLDSSRPRRHLREYGGVGVTIFEGKTGHPDSWKAVRIERDRRFCYKPWLVPAVTYSLRLNDLVDVVVHCSKLNKLRVFN